MDWAGYADVAYGLTLMDEGGLAKAIVDAENDRILGFHIIGLYAAMLIHEVINAMASGETVQTLATGMRIQPALQELVLRPLSRLHAHR